MVINEPFADHRGIRVRGQDPRGWTYIWAFRDFETQFRLVLRVSLEEDGSRFYERYPVRYPIDNIDSSNRVYGEMRILFREVDRKEDTSLLETRRFSLEALSKGHDTRKPVQTCVSQRRFSHHEAEESTLLQKSTRVSNPKTISADDLRRQSSAEESQLASIRKREASSRPRDDRATFRGWSRDGASARNYRRRGSESGSSG